MRIEDLGRLAKLISVKPADGVPAGDVLRLLARTGTILEGHFALQSGAHSPYFIRFRHIGQDPDLAREAARMVLSIAREGKIEGTILCPESAGFYLGDALAELSGAQLAVVRVDRSRRPIGDLSAGKLTAGSRVTIVNDVATSGSSLEALARIARDRGATVDQALMFATLRPAVFDATLNKLGNLYGAAVVAAIWPIVETGTKDCQQCRDGIDLLPASELN